MTCGSCINCRNINSDLDVGGLAGSLWHGGLGMGVQELEMLPCNGGPRIATLQMYDVPRHLNESMGCA